MTCARERQRTATRSDREFGSSSRRRGAGFYRSCISPCRPEDAGNCASSLLSSFFLSLPPPSHLHRGARVTPSRAMRAALAAASEAPVEMKFGDAGIIVSRRSSGATRTRRMRDHAGAIGRQALEMWAEKGRAGLRRKEPREWKGPVCKVRRETRCLISRCYPGRRPGPPRLILAYSRLLASLCSWCLQL